MRGLSISLIVVVVASIIAFGWILNQVYISTTSTQNTSQEDSIYINMGREIYSVFSDAKQPEKFVQQWNESSAFQLSVIEREYFPVPSELQSSFDKGKPLILESSDGIGVHYALLDDDAVLSIAIPVMASVPDNSRLQLILTLSFYAGVTTIILIWIWPLIHQLMKLRETAMLFGKGDLSARVKSQRFSYIREIESEFNRMADRIQSLIRDNKLLSRAVSHDLKTPLARLRFGLDALTESDNETQRARYAERVNRDLEEMESLIETLLQYARLDESRIQLAQENVCLATLTQMLVETHTDEQLAIELHCELPCAEIYADKRYVSMLINNLLNNACRHARSAVRVSLTQKKQRFSLCFEDDGSGIPPVERENAVKPFWRGAHERGKKGHGMGLAIVARIAEWHNAELVIADSSDLGGAAVLLSFPCAGKA